jgi:hypothetical protein
MNDFFGRLELELRAAAERPPRRMPDWRAAARGGGVALVVAAVVAVALIPVLVVTGGGDGGDRSADKRPEAKAALPPVGTVIPKGTGYPPRDSEHTVVATGRAPVAGAWQLEVWRGSGVSNPKTGEIYLRAGGACLGIVLLEPPEPHLRGPSGFCSPNQKLGFRKTPGFSRQQLTVTTGRRIPGRRRHRPEEILVYGVVPERASAVVLSAPGVKVRAEPQAGPKGRRRDYYLIALPADPDLEKGRVNWLDVDGNPGSRGIRLLPP